MREPSEGAAALWEDALLAAAMVAVAPTLLGGAVLKAGPGPVREFWLELLRDLRPNESPWRKIPSHVSEARLLGGLDLTATLQAGVPVVQTGVLSECDGGIAVLAMAERSSRMIDAHLTTALDRRAITVAREGLSAKATTNIGVIALDEGIEDDEHTSPALRERLAFHLDLRPLGIRDIGESPFDEARIAAARDELPRIACDPGHIEALCTAAMALGVDSPRAALQAASAARIASALAGRASVIEQDLDTAVRLVLAPRATRLPTVQEEETATQEPQPDDAEAPPSDPAQNDVRQALEDRLIDAATAAIPANVLALLTQGRSVSRGRASPGKSGVQHRSFARGRPMGTMPGDPRSGARLSLVATLRAAAPWQGLRRSQGDEEGRGQGSMLIRRDDFRVVRFRERSQSTTIFLVDASGSAALNRLAEAKGAVELMLADCYVRRDQVALIAFRGDRAELLLPPTRSLVRAKRNLAGLPGGGGTPLASAIEMATEMAVQLRRRGGTPSVVLLTDGRANIARDGSQGRAAAAADMETTAAQFRAAGLRGMLIDTSPRPHAAAASLAGALGALYLPLPHASAAQLRDAVRAVTVA
jgi:magnesium chelatase subunit D